MSDQPTHNLGILGQPIRAPPTLNPSASSKRGRVKPFTLREGMMKVAPMPAVETGTEANEMKIYQTLKREVVRNTVEVEFKAIKEAKEQ